MVQLSKGEQTRKRLMDLAQEAILQKGFAATSIDELTAGADITKSGFLYHFKDKTDLAYQLLARHLEHHEEMVDSLLKRADAKSDDPLESFLIFLKLLAEMLDELPHPHPGCLAASYLYQDRMFDRNIRDLIERGVMAWRTQFKARLDMITQHYSNADVDTEVLADFISTISEGSIVISKAMNNKHILAQQILLARDYIRRIFAQS